MTLFDLPRHDLTGSSPIPVLDDDGDKDADITMVDGDADADITMVDGAEPIVKGKEKKGKRIESSNPSRIQLLNSLY